MLWGDNGMYSISTAKPMFPTSWKLELNDSTKTYVLVVPDQSYQKLMRKIVEFVKASGIEFEYHEIPTKRQ